jgi:hypothetical protein
VKVERDSRNAVPRLSFFVAVLASFFAFTLLKAQQSASPPQPTSDSLQHPGVPTGTLMIFQEDKATPNEVATTLRSTSSTTSSASTRFR